jgi:hypothetical protein
MQVNSSLVRAALLSALRHDRNLHHNMLMMLTEEADHREHLGDILISSNTHWKDETLSLIHLVLDAEAKVDHVAVNNIPARASAAGGADVVVWRGDITKLVYGNRAWQLLTLPTARALDVLFQTIVALTTLVIEQ